MSKKRLEEIKKHLVLLHSAVDVDDEYKNYIFKDLKVEWLIEQAERVQELERKIERYREALRFYADENNYVVDVSEAEFLEDIPYAKPPIVYERGIKARKALEGKRMSDKEREEFVCDYCGTELDETDEYHTTFHTCDKDCYMKMVGLSWSDFI